VVSEGADDIVLFVDMKAVEPVIRLFVHLDALLDATKEVTKSGSSD